MVWRDNRIGEESDIYGAKIDTNGTVLNRFDISLQEGIQKHPVHVDGVNNQSLFVYSGWIDSIINQLVNTYRIWGKFNTSIGVEEKIEYPLVPNWKLNAFPNPFRENVNINLEIEDEGFKMEEAKLKIYDVSGRLVKSVKLTSNTFELGADLVPGVYFLKLTIGEHKEIQKLIKIR